MLRRYAAAAASQMCLTAIVVVAGALVSPVAAQQATTGAISAAEAQRDSAAREVGKAREAVARAEAARDSVDAALQNAARLRRPDAAPKAILWLLTVLIWLGSWIWLGRPTISRALGAWHGARIALAWFVAIAWMPVTLWTSSVLALASFAVWGATIILTWKWTAARQRAQATRHSD